MHDFLAQKRDNGIGLSEYTGSKSNKVETGYDYRVNFDTEKMLERTSNFLR